MKKLNNKGFSVVEGLLIFVIVGIIGFVGYYVWSSNNSNDEFSGQNEIVTSREEKTEQENNTMPESEVEKATHVENFDLASESFKPVLLGELYQYGKAGCLENAQFNDEKFNNTYVYLTKMVRDDFAQTQTCGSGASQIYKNINGQWKAVASLAEGPLCPAFDKYEISKEISNYCYAPPDYQSKRSVEYR